MIITKLEYAQALFLERDKISCIILISQNNWQQSLDVAHTRKRVETTLLPTQGGL